MKTRTRTIKKEALKMIAREKKNLDETQKGIEVEVIMYLGPQMKLQRLSRKYWYCVTSFDFAFDTAKKEFVAEMRGVQPSHFTDPPETVRQRLIGQLRYALGQLERPSDEEVEFEIFKTDYICGKEFLEEPVKGHIMFTDGAPTLEELERE